MKLCWPIVTLIIDFNYKVLPVTLSEIFMLHFNLRFASLRSFERPANPERVLSQLESNDTARDLQLCERTAR